MLGTYYSYNAVITDQVDPEDPLLPFQAPPVPSDQAAHQVSVQAPILQDLAITYTRHPIQPLPPFHPYQVVVSIPAFHPAHHTSDIVPPERVIDSVRNISNQPDQPPPPHHACALLVFVHVHPDHPLTLIVHHVMLTILAMNTIFPPDQPPPPPNHPEFHDHALAHAHVGLRALKLIAVLHNATHENI